MSEILGSITKVEDDSYDNKDFKKVTLADGQVLKVKYGREGSLKAKWGLLQEGKAIKFTMGLFNNKPFVQDIESIAALLDEKGPVNTEKLAQQARGTPVVNEIETAMWYKEAGEMYRAGALKESNTDMSPEHAKLIKQKYLNRMFKALGIDIQYS